MIAVERSTNISHVLRDNRRAISRAQAAPARSANTGRRVAMKLTHRPSVTPSLGSEDADKEAADMDALSA